MNKRVKALWIQALRSKEFKQGTFKLADRGRFCALGVLCEIALLHGVCTYDDEAYDGKQRRLSYNILRWANIAQKGEKFFDKREQEVVVRVKGRLTTIAQLNDAGVSFNEIALVIEREL